MSTVTISVWNKFHSFPLIDGLARSGLTVSALGTSRTAPRCANYTCCWPSAIATQLGHRWPTRRETFFRFAINSYERFARDRIHKTDCLWGWSNHHLLAFEKAKQLGIPTILETGSTHAAWAHRVLQDEYQKRGLTLEGGLLDELRPKMIAEYEIADFICVPSRFVAKTFLESGVPEEKIHVNPYGADVGFWASTRGPYSRNQRPFIFIYAGQIMLRKGIAYILDAWKLINRKDSELWLVGGVHPDCKGYMRNLPTGVRLLGGKSHDELRAIYAEAGAFLLPSLEEGLARSVLEAMSASLPVIITEETGATDIMVNGEDGWVVPSRDSYALAVAMQHAVTEPDESFRRGFRARQRVEPFTWNTYGDRAASFLRGLLA